MPRRPHGLIDQSVRFLVADDDFLRGIETNLATHANRDVGKVKNGYGAIRGLGIAAGGFARLDSLRKREQWLGVWHCRDFLAAFLVEVVEADATVLSSLVRLAPFVAVEDEREAVRVFEFDPAPTCRTLPGVPAARTVRFRPAQCRPCPTSR